MISMRGANGDGRAPYVDRQRDDAQGWRGALCGLAELFHEQTKMTIRDVDAEHPAIAVAAGIVLAATKEFDGFARTPLPLPSGHSQDTLHLVGNVLHDSAGTVSVGVPGHAPAEQRKNYSAAAAYPIDLYVLSFDPGLGRGTYYYHPADHLLYHLSSTSPSRVYAKLVPRVGDPTTPSLVILLVGAFGRSTYVHGDRGYRHVLLEAGMLVERLQARFLNAHRQVVLMPTFVDDALNEVLRINGTDEALLFALRVEPDLDRGAGRMDPDTATRERRRTTPSGATRQARDRTSAADR
jgi:SagB-type dehydrogenase family enzyme